MHHYALNAQRRRTVYRILRCVVKVPSPTHSMVHATLIRADRALGQSSSTQKTIRYELYNKSPHPEPCPPTYAPNMHSRAHTVAPRLSRKPSAARSTVSTGHVHVGTAKLK